VKLTLKQSGGFAGIEQEPVRVDADRLPEDARERLHSLVSGAAKPPEVVGADLPRYELTIEDGDARHTVAWHDDGGPDAAGLRALAEEVQRAAT
jgi:emfourin